MTTEIWYRLFQEYLDDVEENVTSENLSMVMDAFKAGYEQGCERRQKIFWEEQTQK